MERIEVQDNFMDVQNRKDIGTYGQYLFLCTYAPWAEQNQDKTIGEIAALNQWDAEDLTGGLNLLPELFEKGIQFHYDLWPEEAGALHQDTALCFIPSGRQHPSPFALILPGGGFMVVATIGEGLPIALELQKQGIASFILNYRVGMQYKAPEHTQDIAQALRFICDHAAQFGVKADDYTVIGFSAGGHLAGLWGGEKYGYRRYHLPKPGALMLSYPFITFEFTNEVIEMVKNTLLGLDASPEREADCDLRNHIDADYPPCYLWTCKDDELIPVAGSDALARKMDEERIPGQYTVFEKGGHGIGLGTGTTAEGWLDKAVGFWKSMPGA
jgi:acetyl esterase/lipase